MDYAELVASLPDAELRDELRDLRGLGGVMAWMGRRAIPLSAAEIVQQDEFSLDFVVPLPVGAHIAFGIT